MVANANGPGLRKTAGKWLWEGALLALIHVVGCGSRALLFQDHPRLAVAWQVGPEALAPCTTQKLAYSDTQIR